MQFGIRNIGPTRDMSGVKSEAVKKARAKAAITGPTTKHPMDGYKIDGVEIPTFLSRKKK